MLPVSWEPGISAIGCWVRLIAKTIAPPHRSQVAEVREPTIVDLPLLERNTFTTNLFNELHLGMGFLPRQCEFYEVYVKTSDVKMSDCECFISNAVLLTESIA